MEGQFNKAKIRDPRWLRLDVCRDHTRGSKCRRGADNCCFAHPDSNCVVTNGKVTVCYDSMKGRCQRESCKFYHPSDSTKKSIQNLGKAYEQQRLIEEYGVTEYSGFAPPFYLQGAIQIPRRVDHSDKLPVCSFYLNNTCKRTADNCRFAHPPHMLHEADGFVTVCMDFIADLCDRDSCKYFHPPPHLITRVRSAQLRRVPFMTAESGTSHVSPVPATSENQFQPGDVTGSQPSLVPNPASMMYQQGPSVFLCSMPTAMGQAPYSVYDFE